MNYDYCNGRVHTIKEGDTLYKISSMYRTPLALILRANPYVDVYNLQVGEKLCIPGGFDNNTKPPRPECGPSSGCAKPPVRPPMGSPAQPDDDNNSDNDDMVTGGDCNTGFLHIVRHPQSVQSILDQFEITMEQMLSMNPAENIILNPGTTLKIPGSCLTTTS